MKSVAAGHVSDSGNLLNAGLHIKHCQMTASGRYVIEFENPNIPASRLYPMVTAQDSSVGFHSTLTGPSECPTQLTVVFDSDEESGFWFILLADI